MCLRLGDVFPNFAADAHPEPITSFHQWIGNSWAILFSHPADFTPVCTTELARVVQLSDEFTKRGVKLIALSIDSANSHARWAPDILHIAKYGFTNEDTQENQATPTVHRHTELPFPIIADYDRVLAEQLGMIDPDERNAEGIPLTARAVFVIGPDKRLKLMLLYPASIGRNFDEILRLTDALQLAAKAPVATPVDWKPGQDVMVVPTLTKEEADKRFADVCTIQVPSGQGYLRVTPHP
uniref:1-Cys peroxiredoxin n=1 Tax=Panagrellus redivivus TaxID=6233 RepID=A0A7E4VG88_PANRE